MIEALQREAVEIREVAGDVQLGNLALAITQVLVAAREPVEQQRAVRQLDTRIDDDRVGRMLAMFTDRAADGVFLFGRKRVASAQLREMASKNVASPCVACLQWCRACPFASSRRTHQDGRGRPYLAHGRERFRHYEPCHGAAFGIRDIDMALRVQRIRGARRKLVKAAVGLHQRRMDVSRGYPVRMKDLSAPIANVQ
jgi:hypothetical protein